MDIKLKTRIAIIVAVFLFAVFLGDQYRFSPTGMVVQDFYSLDYTLANLDEAKELFNANLDKVPNFAKTLFGNEKMRVEVTRSDGTVSVISVETEDGAIKTITTNPFDSYTLKVWVRESTINEIIGSDNQVERFKQAIDNQEIRYEAMRFSTSMKIRMSRIFLKVFSLF